jgi:hypothetical protein
MSFSRPLARALLLFAAGLPPAFAADAASAACSAPATRAAMATLVSQIDHHWNVRDAAAMTALYVDEATIGISADDVYAEGRAQIGAYFATAFEQLPKEFKHAMTLGTSASVGQLCSMDTRAAIERANPDGSRTGLIELSGYWLLRPGPHGMRIVAVRVALLPKAPAKS